ncbi:hypothetical protein E4T56_gene16530 [Termitomyces sp. T112]|nr:hypothetical protein E4T56_gene16530 [Termitomyces sp. T112]
MGTTNLYQRNIWKLHGLFNTYVSDWGLQFVAEFTYELYRLLGVKLHTTTAYYPQSDGQMEHDDWDELLLNAKFQYNNHVHASTQFSPFFLNTGWHPYMGFKPQA